MDNAYTNIDPELSQSGWRNAPTVDDLKGDLLNCKNSHDIAVSRVDQYMTNLRADPLPKIGEDDTRSRVQVKLIRKQAEWRYSALSEPFLGTSDIFKVNPVSYEDGFAAKQNELVLNYQFNTQLNKIKLIDNYVRSAVDTGTSVLRVGWEESQDIIDTPVPQYQLTPIDPQNQLALAKFERVKRQNSDTIYTQIVPDYWKQAIQQADMETAQRNEQVTQMLQAQFEQELANQPPEVAEQLQGQMQELIQQQIAQLPPIAYEPVQSGISYESVTKVINRPTVSVCHYKDVYIDPSCEGDIEKAEYIIYKFTSCKADLVQDKKYSNIEQIPDTALRDVEDSRPSEGDNLKDPARRKITVYEYWGNWDINGDGTKVAIVATWVENVMIRLEENPFPDHKPPFVIVPYLPITNSIYGEPDGALLSDNQQIISAITRGIIDLLAKSANSQTGTAIQFLDPINKKKFHKGMDYEFNPNIPPQQAIFQHTFPEIPQTVMPFIQSLQFEAEALTGVKGFTDGINGDQLGATAAGVRGVLDASSKREMGILRRLADGLKQVARKIIAMNALWLNDNEVIRVTNQDFVDIRRDDLAGNFDLQLDISSAEQDQARAESLAFMLQTLGNTVDQGMTQMILSEICRLRKMPELAERVARWQPPEPDPVQQQLQQLQIQLLQAQIQKYQAEANKAQSSAQLDGAKAQSEMVEAQIKPQEIMSKIQSEMAKAKYNDALTRKMDLDFNNDITGKAHSREMEKQSAQAMAQLQKSMQEKAMDYKMSRDKAYTDYMIAKEKLLNKPSK